jgi:hypothetical protein
MSQALTSATVPQIYKELYDSQKVQWLTYKDNPFLAMIHKITKFGGKYWPNPVVYSLTQGASATYSYADANQTSADMAEFLVTRVADFSLATIDGQLLAAAQTDPESFIASSELMIDACWQTATNRIASAMFRNGAGTIAQIGSVVGAGPSFVLTLTNPDDAVQFEVGQVLVAVQNADGSGSAPVDVGSITAVDRNLGTLTMNSGTNLVADWPVLYFLAIQGDLPTLTNNNFHPSGSSQTNALLKLAGIQAWLPQVAPAPGGSFFGVDRSLDVQRLSGVFYDGTGGSIEEAIQSGTARIAMQGGRVDVGICSYATYNALIISLGSKVVYLDEKIGEIGFRGVQVNGANTTMSIFPDRNCPDGAINALEMDSWVLRSQNEAPHILKYMDEIEVLRVPGADSAQLRIGGYMNMYTKMPGHNGVIAVQLNEF